MEQALWYNVVALGSLILPRARRPSRAASCIRSSLPDTPSRRINVDLAIANAIKRCQRRRTERRRLLAPDRLQFRLDDANDVPCGPSFRRRPQILQTSAVPHARRGRSRPATPRLTDRLITVARPAAESWASSTCSQPPRRPAACVEHARSRSVWCRTAAMRWTA